MTTLTDRPTLRVPAPRGASGDRAGTPAGTTPLPPRTIYPLTWLRALAAFAVVVYHAYQLHARDDDWSPGPALHRTMLGTELFVEMFFVLSGFVLWLPVARTVLEGRVGRPGRVVLFRRLGRLLPLYYVVVLLVWALTNPTFPGHWRDLLMHLTFTHVYSDQYIFWTNGPAWTLAVEFHFYVLMALSVPVVHTAVRRVTSRSARLAVALSLPALLVLTGVAYLVWMTVWSQPALDDWSVLFSPLSRAADFGIGMAVAVATAAGVRLRGRTRMAAAVLGTVTLVALVASRPVSLAGEWWHPLYAVAIAITLTSIVFHDGPWPAPLQRPELAWIGGLGYGIYLIHEPVMRLLGTAGVLPAPRPGAWFLATAALVAVPTVALAWLSSRTVERAGLRLVSTIDRDGRPREYYAHLREDRTDGRADAPVGDRTRAVVSVHDRA